MTRGVPTPGRAAIEKLLADNHTLAFTPAEVVARTGLEMAEVRMHLANAQTKQRIHNTTPLAREARYQWGQPAQKPITYRPRPGNYDGRELQAYTGRPGAMRAFDLPSLVAGERTPRVPPIAMSSKSEPRR